MGHAKVVMVLYQATEKFKQSKRGPEQHQLSVEYWREIINEFLLPPDFLCHSGNGQHQLWNLFHILQKNEIIV